MKKIISLFALCLCCCLMLSLSGCRSWTLMNEGKLYEETLENFFTALDNADKAAIKALFSQTVLKNDTDLDDQIDKLLSIYPHGTTEIKHVGFQQGGYEKHDGKYKARANQTTPVICNSAYFWVYMELVYVDDFDNENIGISRVSFFTADEYCLHFHNDDRNISEDLGLLVFADQLLDKEVRPINRYPYAYTPTEQMINAAEVEEFLKSNRSWADFTAKFGQPNVDTSIWSYYYYEISGTGGERQYLQIRASEDEIEYVSIVGEFEFIRTILDEDQK